MFEKQFDLRYFEMGAHEEASPVTMLTLLEETASDHCLSIGHTLFHLLERGVGWVLLSGRMEMDRYPGYKETITIKTWLSELSTFRGTRENIIYDVEGSIIGRAKGYWLFYDIKRKRPARIFEEMLDRWVVNPEESIQMQKKNIEPLESARYTNKFQVHRYDMDSNEHVNNLRYLQWAMESIPDHIVDTCYLHSIDGYFVGEAQYGHTVESLAEPDDAHGFIHTIKDLDSNQICSTAKTTWKLRT